jgi:cell division protein FtsZ
MKQAPGKPSSNYLARIKVIGVGGGGGNAVSRMSEELGVRGVEFIAINTDAQDLDYCAVKRKIYIGKNLTRGLGTGMNPELGRQAAEENRSDIAEAVKGADLVFITAGLGGGTGSGACPVIAEAAKEAGALTVAVVTKPFLFEGAQRSRIAQEAYVKLKDKVDTIIAVPNDRIFSIIKKDTPILKAFEHIDEVLRNAVEGIAEIIAMPGIVNVDFADVRAIMADAGVALVGVGSASGADRAIHAVTQAVNSPLLEISIDGAKGVLFGVSGGRDLKMTEVNDIAKVISGSIDPAAKVIFGVYYDRKLRPGQVKVTAVATGFNGHLMRDPEPIGPTLFGSGASQMKTTLPEFKERPAPAKQGEEKRPERKTEKPSEKLPEKSPKSESVWDIPTFLRRGKKR